LIFLDATAFISGYVKPKSNLMKRTLLVLLLASQMMAFAQTQPVAPVKIVTDEYFGQKIDDPYRYLEDLKDPDVDQWFKGQGDYTRGVLDKIQGRDQLLAKFKEFDKRQSHSIYSLNITENDMYFYLKETPQDETGKLFYRNGFDGEEKLLFDPEKFRTEEKVHYTISSISPNKDGSKIGVSVSANGAENATIMVMDVKKESFYEDQLYPCWTSFMNWLPDGNSFFYGRNNSDDVHENEATHDTKTYYHKVGENQGSDKEMLSRRMYPELEILAEEYPVMVYDKDTDLLYAIISTVENNMKIFYASSDELKNEKVAWKELIARSDKVEDFYTDSNNFYFRSTKGAANYKILKTPLDNPNINNAEVFVAEKEDEVLRDFVITSDSYYYTTMKNGVEGKVYAADVDGGEFNEVKLPYAAGRVSITNKDINHDDFWISIAGWTNDNHRYKYSKDDASFKDETLSFKPDYPEFDDLVVEEIMVPSHDGVMVPVSIVYKKDMVKNGDNSLMLYGYGSYGNEIRPFFWPVFLSWVDEGGILVVSHVRGGGELGDKWHKAGFKSTKPNTWKDFIATAEYLHENKYSSPEKTAIFGGSAGGILVGRAMTDRPDLFAVAIPSVGCMNPVRMENSPNGPVNAPEFGTVAIEEEFKGLYEMDTYLHIKDGVKYPATMATAGMNDPRVIAWQPGKFAARLQAANASDNPILFRVDYESGHGIGDSKTKTFEEFADIFGFAFWQTGHPSYQSIKTEDGQLAK
jgi:prolyl oligopeptidase